MPGQLASGVRMGVHHQVQPEGKDPQSRDIGRVSSSRCSACSRDELIRVHSFERCLTEPLALRPDDVLEGILIQFLKNLRPTLRNTLTYVPSAVIVDICGTPADWLSRAETIQTSLSNYISEQLLNSAEFTVWDRPWASNEEVRGGCCNDAPNRTELGRLRYYGEPPRDRVDKNPIKRIMEKGGGLFELDWRDRAKLLRQLVDWQCAFSSSIVTRWRLHQLRLCVQ